MMTAQAVLQADREEMVIRMGELSDRLDESGTAMTADQRAEFEMVVERVESIDRELELRRRADALELDVRGEVLSDAEQSERRDYDVLNAVRAQFPASWLPADFDWGFEREVSDELSARSGRSYDGVAVPFGALTTRAVTITADGSGNTDTGQHAVAQNLMPGEYVDLLRNSMVTPRLGVRTLMGLVGNPEIPRAASGVTGGWRAEMAAFPEENLTFDQITMSPHKMGVIGEFSRYALLQMTPDIEGLYRRDMSEALARLSDTAIIYGDSSVDANQPDGVVQALTPITSGTNGGDLTLARVQAMYGKLDDDNVPASARAWLTNHKVVRSAQTIRRLSGAATDSTLIMPGSSSMEGDTVVSSEMVEGARTKGTGTGLSDLIYGEWSDVLVGYWEDLDILVNPYEGTAYKRGSVLIRAMMVLDVVLRRGDTSFAYRSDVSV